MPKNKNKTYGRTGRTILASEGRSRNLVKIGELARSYNILPSTINFYTREGLLPEAARSRGGYRLYHRDTSLALLKKIDHLQRDKRLSIEEIKRHLT